MGSQSRQMSTDEEKLNRFEDIRKLVGDQETRLQNLQNVGFQLANYYFIFQGVILAAISNSSSPLICSHRWFLFVLSLLAAVVNLCALFTIGLRYIYILAQYDKSWSELNDGMRGLSSGVDQQQRTPEIENQPWEDQCAKAKRYFFLCMSIVLFLGFAGVILTGCWKIKCRHDDCYHCPHSNHFVDCFKLCNDSKCMMLCDYFK